MSSQSLQRDDSCPNGGVFYSCSQGFVGCCLVEACNPGVGCPPDKDRTPSESSSSSASTTISVLTSSATPSSTSASFSTNAASFSIPTSRSSASDLATSISGVIATESPKPSHLDDNSVPTAALVGAVLGGVILIAMIAGLVLYLRHRKRTKVYKAAVYPSPHVGCDMSPQLPDCQEPQPSRFAGLIGTKQKFAHQLDSREVIPTAEMGEATPRHILFAELPASNTSARNV